ncbi:ribosomal protein S19 binding protein 1 isoform X1 [Rhinichthys klamathensis goyatoka]|uniref:ribosomal protein S19 binding protein 1 isoform X1 n=1 Tax=Rhinichthys klamathensis goyatoka TaxID=3034132 RepID=UPI0024B5A3D1|nr:ribosomal protein S19 binding protein 1 isoform X1 [Rhinichthys klamathensis goyatoka]
MSASLIRRGLELFSEKDAVKHRPKKSSSRKSALMKRISTDKQGVQKRIRQIQRPGGSSRRSTNTVKDKHVRSALDEYRKKQKKSKLGLNLKYFLSSASKTQSSHATKIVEQKSSRRACHQPDRPARKPAEESVFTEDEFQKFQKEYFSNL